MLAYWSFASADDRHMEWHTAFEPDRTPQKNQPPRKRIPPILPPRSPITITIPILVLQPYLLYHRRRATYDTLPHRYPAAAISPEDEELVDLQDDYVADPGFDGGGKRHRVPRQASPPLLLKCSHVASASRTILP